MKQPVKIIDWPGDNMDFSGGPLVMGILNVTPDSFSDGGQFLDIDEAVAHGVRMAGEGAAIIDVGPESTRPGSKPVSEKEQIDRAVPVIEKLALQVKVPISIDTRNYAVARAAIDSGVSIINDVTALADERMAKLAAEKDLPVVLMHMQGEPKTMQAEPEYDDVVGEVLSFLLEKAEAAEKAGIDKDKIFIDPGIGFGKTEEHNISLLKNIDRFVDSGYRVLLGTSRKRFIGDLTGRKDAAQRVFGTAATVALAVAAGVSIVRVHDVAAMVDVVKVANALNTRGS